MEKKTKQVKSNQVRKKSYESWEIVDLRKENNIGDECKYFHHRILICRKVLKILSKYDKEDKKGEKISLYIILNDVVKIYPILSFMVFGCKVSFQFLHQSLEVILQRMRK